MELLKSIWQIDEIITGEIARLIDENIEKEIKNEDTIPYIKMLDILFNKYIESLRLFSFSNEDGVGCIYQADIKKELKSTKMV